MTSNFDYGLERLRVVELLIQNGWPESARDGRPVAVLWDDRDGLTGLLHAWLEVEDEEERAAAIAAAHESAGANI